MTYRLRVDPTRCDGRGLCAELLPERVRADDWGYPIIAPEPVGEDLLPLARRAVDACPLLALRLERLGSSTGGGTRPPGAGRWPA